MISASSAPFPVGSAGEILVVDDVASVRFYHTSVLRRAGLTCHSAGSIAEAEQILRAHPVRVLVLDRGLPGESGDEFLERLRADAAYAGLLVIVITTELPAAPRADTRYLRKPLSPGQFIDAVRRLLEDAGGTNASAPTLR